MKTPSYLIEGLKSNNIALELARLQNEPNHNPNYEILQGALDVIQTIDFFNKPVEESLDKLSERVFYTRIMFQDYNKPEIFNLEWQQINFERTSRLVTESLSCSKKTIERLLKGNTPSNQALAQVEELFDYVADECLKRSQRNFFGRSVCRFAA